MTGLHGRPTAAELIAAVAEFLEEDVRKATSGSVNFHARVAVNVLRTVERELLDRAAKPDLLGYEDERALADAIRSGELDDRGHDVMACLHDLVRHRLAVSHPGYDQEMRST